MRIGVPGAFITAAVSFAGADAALERTLRPRSAAVSGITFAVAPSREGAGLVTVGTRAAGAGSGLPVAPTGNGGAMV